MDSVAPASSGARESRPPRPSSAGRRPRLGQLLHRASPRSPRLSISFPEYRRAGGAMDTRRLAKVMSMQGRSKPNSRIRQMALKLCTSLGESFSEREIEFCAMLLAVKGIREDFPEMKKGGPAREWVLNEIRCLSAASCMR